MRSSAEGSLTVRLTAAQVAQMCERKHTNFIVKLDIRFQGEVR